MAAITIAPDPTRAFYDRVVKSVSQSFGISEEQVRRDYVLSPQTVLIGVLLQPNQTTYQLNPRNNVGVGIPTDNRLDQNDYFAMQAVGLKFGRATYNSSTGQISQVGNYPKFTYPDPNYFNGNPASGLDEWQCLQTVLNGKLSLVVGSQQVIPQDSIQKLAYNPWGTYTSSPLALPQYNGLADPAARGNFNLPMNFILDLNQDNNFNIVLADGDTAVIDGSINSGGTASTVRNILWLELEGIVIKNMGGNRQGNMAC